MKKVSNALMGLVGTAGAAAYIASLVFSGAVSQLTGIPLMLQLAVVAAGVSALLIGLTPAYALVSGGGGEKAVKEKKAKKGKKSKSAAAVADDGVDDFADDSMVTDGFDDEFGESYDSVAADESAFLSEDEMTESGVARSIETAGGTGDDPFDISDSFESDVNDIDLSMSADSEAFDDQFELSPDSGVDFDDFDEDDTKKA